ncbi:MAG TPA: PA14 domain-containing protein, partial [Tepidisphaeraceae bacterium]|nr:PA14 domain-containing protein [Tepidisphaeraceae bacterium]
MRTTVRSIVKRLSNSQHRNLIGRACAAVIRRHRFGLEGLEARQLLSLPAGWADQDIGTTGDPAVAGSASFGVDETSGLDTFAVTGGGSDIWDIGTAGQFGDHFHYVYQELEGDGEIIADLAYFTPFQSGLTNPWAKAGVMFRSSLDATSSHALAAMSSNYGFAFQGRANTGGASSNTNTSIGYRDGTWLKLTRQGNTYTAAYSTDSGETWYDYTDANGNIVKQYFNLTNKVYVGLAVSSHDNNRVDEAKFDNVTVTAIPVTGAPNAPVSFSAVINAARDGINVSWFDNANNETGFILERSTNPNFSGAVDRINLPADTYSYNDTNVTAGTLYYYRLRAVNASGNSDWTERSSWIAGQVNGVTARYFNNIVENWSGTPVAMQQLGSINSDWASNAPMTGVNGDFCVSLTGRLKAPQAGTYTFIGRSDDMGYVYLDGQTVSSDPGAHGVRDATNVTAVDLEADTWYTIMMNVCDTGGGAVAQVDWVRPDGVRERIPSQYFIPTMATPEAPTNLTVSDAGNQLDFTWDDNTTIEQGYVFERATDANFSSVTVIATLGVDATSVSDSALEPNTTYWYRVRAFNYDASSSSNVVQFRTGANVGQGLLGTYYNGFATGTAGDGTKALIRLDGPINFDYGSNSPGPGVNIDKFFIRWEGTIKPTVSGPYVFGTSSDDGMRLWVNGQLVNNPWIDRGQDAGNPQETSLQAVTLQAGVEYPIIVDMYENGGGAGVHVWWHGPGMGMELIPL